MIREEAKAIIEANAVPVFPLQIEYQDWLTAIHMAEEALDKRIPKPPICVEDKMWCCPECDNNLLNKWVKYPTKLVPKSAGLPYCMSCGQAIDWSEED